MHFDKAGEFYYNYGRFYEDFEINTKFRTASRTMFEADIVNFVNLSGIHEELYTNAEYAERHNLFKRRFAPGPLTFSLAEGLAVQTMIFDRTGLALLETTLTLHNPVFIGDTFYVDILVTDKRETSKPDRGIVYFEHHVTKTDGTHVATITKTRMIRRRSSQEMSARA